MDRSRRQEEKRAGLGNISLSDVLFHIDCGIPKKENHIPTFPVNSNNDGRNYIFMCFELSLNLDFSDFIISKFS